MTDFSAKNWTTACPGFNFFLATVILDHRPSQTNTLGKAVEVDEVGYAWATHLHCLRKSSGDADVSATSCAWGARPALCSSVHRPHAGPRRRVSWKRARNASNCGRTASRSGSACCRACVASQARTLASLSTVTAEAGDAGSSSSQRCPRSQLTSCGTYRPCSRFQPSDRQKQRSDSMRASILIAPCRQSRCQTERASSLASFLG